MTYLRTTALVIASLLLLANLSASAQEAPTPKRSPRTPVSQQVLLGNKAPMPPSRNVEGAATIIDTEKLRIGDVEMRLFGVVPPQLSASYGPQARGLLDNLAMGVTVRCAIRDRDRSGWFLATCRGANNADFSLELLRRGLAVTARGSLRPTELAAPYEAAEQAAQAQKLGLWSVTLPPAVSEAKIREASARNEVANATANTTASPKEMTDKTENKTEAKSDSTVNASSESPPKNDKAESAAPKLQPSTLKTIEPLPVTLQNFPDETVQKPEQISTLERYQLLLTGLLMLLTATGVLIAFGVQRWIDRREELRSIAAALRGELMAARAVCQARLSSITDETDEKNVTWPRIRAMVFQAYVGRLGLLGAELARQIASIYGQASDYAAYYNAPASHENKVEPASKRQALQTLVRYIEEVLPRLANIERQNAPAKRLPTANKTRPQHEPVSITAPATVAAVVTPAVTVKEAIKQDSTEKVETKETKTEITTPETKAPEFAAETTTEEPAFVAAVVAEAPAPVAKSATLWNSIRRFATQRLERAPKIPVEDQIPDYASMTDEEIEALAYSSLSDEEESQKPANKVSNVG